MKLSFTEKLILDDVQKTENGFEVKFKSYLKEDFIERALTIGINSQGVVERIYFSSNDFGTAKWSNGYGLYDAHRWESEDDLISISTLARRYPSILEDGPVAGDFALLKIIPDVLDNLLDSGLSQLIHSIVHKKSSQQVHDWNKIIASYREKSEEFIEGLIKKYEKIVEDEDVDGPVSNGPTPGVDGNLPEGDERISSHRHRGSARGNFIFERVASFISLFRQTTEDNGHDEAKRYLKKAKSLAKKLNKK